VKGMLDRILRYLKIFFLNPKVFVKKVFGRILLRIAPSPNGIVQVNIGGYAIDTLPSRNDWWKSMYLRCCGVEIVHNIKKYLPIGGIFIDAGAGVGYFSAIASNVVGISGQVHCFEPQPLSASAIEKMIKNNPQSNITLNSYALGADECDHKYYIQRLERYTATSMVSGVVDRVDEVLNVRMRRLDTYLLEKEISTVSLIKIDVEGYEYYLLKGLSRFFERTACKPPIICEILVSVYKNNDFSIEDLFSYMASYGYHPYNIFNPRKRVDIRKLYEDADVIFISAR
jgi:FkbM family methyltransferase